MTIKEQSLRKMLDAGYNLFANSEESVCTNEIAVLDFKGEIEVLESRDCENWELVDKKDYFSGAFPAASNHTIIKVVYVGNKRYVAIR